MAHFIAPTKHQEEMRMLIEHMRQVKGGLQWTDHGYAYCGTEDFLMQHGIWYPPNPWTGEFKGGAPRQCFGNALLLAVSDGLRYVVVPVAAKQPELPTLTLEQLFLIQDNIFDKRDHAIFMVGTFCALRTSEVFGMTWGCLIIDVRDDKGQPKEGHFAVTKTAYRGEHRDKVKTKRSKSDVPVGPDTMKSIMEWKEKCKDISPEALMFPSTNRNGRGKQGAPMYGDTWLQKHLQPICWDLGINFHVNFRCTRRTASTLTQEKEVGGSLGTSSGLLRHSSTRTTAEIYTQPVREEVRRVVNGYEAAVNAARPQPKGPVRIK